MAKVCESHQEPICQETNTCHLQTLVVLNSLMLSDCLLSTAVTIWAVYVSI